MAIPRRKPRRRQFNIRSLSNVIAGRELPYPDYRFSGKIFRQRPADAAVTGDVLTIPTPAVVVQGTVGVAYGPVTYIAAGGTAPYTYLVTGNGRLPPGLSMSGAGVLSGTPTEAGTFTWELQALDSSSEKKIGFRQVTLVVT